MPRFASIDIGTNSVLLLVAERGEDGRFTPVLERAEITRLGRGVDKTRTLAPEAIDETLRVVKAYADEARALGAAGIATSATSAARDASNGAAFLAAARERAGVLVEIISGELEAQLSYSSAWSDFGEPGRPLVVIDIGGGSTELIYGDRAEAFSFRRSFEVGSVRLTERLVRTDPMSPADRTAVEDHLRQVFGALPPPLPGFRVVGVAGTVTTLYAIQHAIEPYDATKVHGAFLGLAELRALADRLCQASLEERRRMPGLQPKRADVIPVGALVLLGALERLGADGCRVSDKGLRWGLLAHRFGAKGEGA
ncbi:MAG: Ppx/GppA phosphatase family protein [Myxococcaceae bacterium]